MKGAPLRFGTMRAGGSTPGNTGALVEVLELTLVVDNAGWDDVGTADVEAVLEASEVEAADVESPLEVADDEAGAAVTEASGGRVS